MNINMHINFMESFKIKNDFIELNKLLKATGFCDTGGMAKMVIQDGLVHVDGETEYRVRCKIKKGQIISFEGQQVQVL